MVINMAANASEAELHVAVQHVLEVCICPRGRHRVRKENLSVENLRKEFVEADANVLTADGEGM